MSVECRGIPVVVTFACDHICDQWAQGLDHARRDLRDQGRRCVPYPKRRLHHKAVYGRGILCDALLSERHLHPGVHGRSASERSEQGWPPRRTRRGTDQFQRRDPGAHSQHFPIPEERW